MYKITHPVEKFITFDDCFINSYNSGSLDTIRVFKELMIKRIILILSLATGLEMKYVYTIKWKELLTLGTENNAIVKDELRVRKYYIPIHPKVKFLLSDLYCKLGYPNPELEIIKTVPKIIKTEYDFYNLSEWVLRGGSSYKNEINKIGRNHLEAFNFDIYSQILFGRKVFAVNGYTNDICKFLKLHFKFRTNKELFSFLGYESKDDIQFDLVNINLNAVGVFIQLEDKNFNDDNNSPFQKFTAFSKFLLSEIVAFKGPITNSVRLLLLISLYSGIKPSRLIRLKWHQLIHIDEEEKTIEIKKLFVFENQKIKIYKEFENNLLEHFVYTAGKTQNITFYYKASLKQKFSERPSLEGNVFVTNKNNPLTQPSLSREIKKTLQNLRFPHAEKLTSTSTVIMYGRRIMEIKGDHKPTIQKLKEHFKFKSKKELFDFLHLTGSRDKAKEIYNFKGKVRKNIFEGILYDI